MTAEVWEQKSEELEKVAEMQLVLLELKCFLDLPSSSSQGAKATLCPRRGSRIQAIIMCGVKEEPTADTVWMFQVFLRPRTSVGVVPLVSDSSSRSQDWL